MFCQMCYLFDSFKLIQLFNHFFNLTHLIIMQLIFAIPIFLFILEMLLLIILTNFLTQKFVFELFSLVLLIYPIIDHIFTYIYFFHLQLPLNIYHFCFQNNCFMNPFIINIEKFLNLFTST